MENKEISQEFTESVMIDNIKKLNKMIEGKIEFENANNILYDLEKQLKGLQRRVSDCSIEAQPKARYGNIVITVKVSDGRWYSQIPIGTETINITKFLLNKDEKEEHLKKYGSIGGNWDERQTSVTYYRKGQVLAQAGGGYVFLETSVICTDEQWNQIKNGEFGYFERKSSFA